MPKITAMRVHTVLVSRQLPVVKVERVSFQDLARDEAYFVRFSVRGDYGAVLREISEELGVKVIQQP